MYCKSNSYRTQIKEIRTNEKVLLPFSFILEFATFNLVSLAIFIERKIEIENIGSDKLGKCLQHLSFFSKFHFFLLRVYMRSRKEQCL